jgi:hypothetical protein
MRRSQRLLFDQQLLGDSEPLQLGGRRHRLRQDPGLRLRDLVYGDAHRLSRTGHSDHLQQFGLHLESGLHRHAGPVLDACLGPALQSIGGLRLERHLVRRNSSGL